jgi:hypothetical protein
VTLAAMVEKETSIEVCPDDLMFVVIKAQATPKYERYVLDHELYVYGPDEFLRLMIEQVGLDSRLRIYQVGADGVYWGWVTDRRVSYNVLKGETENGNFHFRMGDSEGKLSFDPDPSVRVVKELSQIHYQANWLG